MNKTREAINRIYQAKLDALKKSGKVPQTMTLEEYIAKCKEAQS